MATSSSGDSSSQATNLALLDYGTSPSFPSMLIPNVGKATSEATQKASEYFKTKAEELQAQFDNLLALARATERVNNAEKRFLPITGKEYHLYIGERGDFLSLIAPHEWTINTKPKDYIGSFTLSTDGTWIQNGKDYED